MTSNDAITSLLNVFCYAVFSNIQALRECGVGENLLFDLAVAGRIRLVDSNAQHNFSRWAVLA